VRVNEEGQYARRAAHWDILPAASHPILERFVQARLLVSSSVGETRILEVAHEALFRTWSRLKQWLDQDREFLLWRQRLQSVLVQWRVDHDQGRLLRGVALIESQRWLKARADGLDAEEQAFIRHSIALRQRWRRIGVWTVIAVFVIVTTLGGVVWRQRGAAVAARDAANAQLLHTFWLNGISARDDKDDALRAGHYFMRSAALTTDEIQARIAYLAGQLVSGHVHLAEVLPQDKKIRSVAFNADGTVHVSPTEAADVPVSRDPASCDLVIENNTVRLSGYSARELKHNDKIDGAVCSRDKTRILTWSEDDTVAIWVTQSGERLLTLRHKGDVRGAVFNSDETQVLSWSDDGSARLWDSYNGQPLSMPLMHGEKVWGADFSTDRAWVLTWSDDATARIWDLANPQQPMRVAAHALGVKGAALSHDKQHLLSWSDDGTMRVWDSRDNGPERAKQQHGHNVRGAAFRNDAMLILSWGEDLARLWDRGMHQALKGLIPVLRQPDLKEATFSADDRSILTWGGRLARLWDSRTGWPLTPRLQHEGEVVGALLDPTGQQLLTWSWSEHNDIHIARVWHLAAAEHPPWYSLWQRQEVISGTRLTHNGELEILTPEEWKALKAQWDKQAR